MKTIISVFRLIGDGKTPLSILMVFLFLGCDNFVEVDLPPSQLNSSFVFNEEALRKLQLSSKRIYFYLETLQDLAQRRDLTILIGSPYEYAADIAVAVTYAPVPSFQKFRIVAELHPFPWLKAPHAKSVRSFSAWRGKI